MKFSVVTILPELIEPALTAGVVGRAREAGVITVETVNPRDFTTDRHRTVDDNPYGGGPGMVMKAEPLLAAIANASGEDATSPPPHRIFLSPAGAPLTQARVKQLAQLPHLVLVCGRYEGIDDRVIELAIDEELSIGDYVLSGGELGALVIIDACARYVPGVLGEATSTDDESHAAGLLEYPQYTRPPKLVASKSARADAGGVVAASAGESTADDGGASSPSRAQTTVELEVPAILSSGNHAAIAAWRRSQSLARTARRRPDLFAKVSLTAADRKQMPPLHARTHLALVHHPCVDRTGKIVTTSLTNFDVHDLARSTATYGLAAYHIVTPITSQREKAEHIAGLWLEDEQARIEAARAEAAAARSAAEAARIDAARSEAAGGEGAPDADEAARSATARAEAVARSEATGGHAAVSDAARGQAARIAHDAPARGEAPRSPGRESRARARAVKAPSSASRAGALALVRTADSVETVIAELTAEYGRAPLVVGTSAKAESFPSAPRRSPSELFAEASLDPGPVLILLGTGWGLADELIPSVSRVLAPIEGVSGWNHLSVRSAGAILLDRLFGR
jgi:tRNA (guanine37-N1)-methyltransferase